MIEDFAEPAAGAARSGWHGAADSGAARVVTGAGGTIGSELARQVAAFGPGSLVLIDNGEFALWQIDMELAETHPSVRPAVADRRYSR